MTTILGIQRGHDAGVCLMRDGRVLCAVESERVHRIKHADGPGTIPESARVAFQQTGVDPKDIDGIVIADSFRDRIESALPASCDDLHGTKLLGPIGLYGAIPEISDIGIPGILKDTPVLAACHHACHAATALYMSEYANALVYVYDGWGVCAATVAYDYDDGALRRLQHSVDRILVGWRYELLAHFITEIDYTNTKGYDFAGKLMGLCSFGSPRDDAVQYLKTWLRQDFDEYKSTWEATDKVWFRGLVNKDGFSRNSTNSRDPAFQTLLASLQVALNEVVCEEITGLLKETKTRNVIITGGCALNIIANDAVEKLDGIDTVFVPPNTNDGGLAMGAAIIGSAYAMESKLHFPDVPLREKRNPFKGSALLGKPQRSKAHKVARLSRRAALDRVVDALRTGGIVGFVQGPIEVGPRALGHRSLLADATDPDIRDRIGARIKLREWWRPFSPAARSADASDYFLIREPCPYMLRTATVREEWREKLSSIVHVDDSVRLQVVLDEASDPALWYILSELKRRTGIGVCLNTSLNLSGSPILNSYDEIYEFLQKTTVDFMYVDGRIIERS